jgi:hypothetical protein
MGDGTPDRPPISESTLSAPADAGHEAKVGADAAGALIVAWVTEDGRVLSRYQAPSGSFGAAELAGEAATGSAGDLALAIGADGVAYLAYVAEGAVWAARRPAGGASDWEAPQILSAPGGGAHSIDLAAAAGEACLAFVAADGQGGSRVFVSTFAPG